MRRYFTFYISATIVLLTALCIGIVHSEEQQFIVKGEETPISINVPKDGMFLVWKACGAQAQHQKFLGNAPWFIENKAYQLWYDGWWLGKEVLWEMGFSLPPESQPKELPSSILYQGADCLVKKSEPIKAIDSQVLLLEPGDEIHVSLSNEANRSLAKRVVLILLLLTLIGGVLFNKTSSKTHGDLVIKEKFNRFDPYMIFGVSAVSIALLSFLPFIRTLIHSGRLWELFVVNQALTGAVFIGLSLIFVFIKSSHPHITLGLGTKSRLPLWAAAFLGIGVAIAGIIIMLIFPPKDGSATSTFFLNVPSILSLTAFFALFAAFSEEVFFRGLLQTAFKGTSGDSGKWPIVSGILLSSAFFVMLHIVQNLHYLLALIPIGILSVASGFWREYSRSLHGSIIMHLCYNATLVMPALWFSHYA